MTASLDSIPLTMLDGRATTFGEFAGDVVLVVNVASRCGFTPQYQQLEELQKRYADRGFTVLGMPSMVFARVEGPFPDDLGAGVAVFSDDFKARAASVGIEVR